MENVRKHRDIKLITTEIGRNYLVSELNYHTTKFFTENLLVIEMKIAHMNKPVYLGLLILELSKILKYEFWYRYAIPKYGEKKLFYVDTDSFIVYIETDDIYKDNAEDVETRFDTSNYELGRPLPKGKNKKVIGLMKDELGEKKLIFVRLRAKTYSYLINGGKEYKKGKDTNMCVIKIT